MPNDMELNDLQQSVIDVLVEAGAHAMHNSLSREAILDALAAMPGLDAVTGNALGPCLAGLKRRGLVQMHLNECWSLTEAGQEGSSSDGEEATPSVPDCSQCGRLLSEEEQTYYEFRCERCEIANHEALNDDEPETADAPLGGADRLQQLTRGLGRSFEQLRNQHDDELQAEMLAVIDGLGELAAQEYRRTADPHIGELPSVCADLRRRVERARICIDGSDREVAA